MAFSCSDSDAPIEEPQGKASLPTLTTTSVSGITESSAISGGNITENGGASITARGIVWSTSTEPTISDNKTANATGTGEFSSTLEGLEGNTTYYLRAYATNSEGTAYGNEFSFTTLEEIFEENIFDGDVILKNQNDVDAFASQKYTSITGELQILGTEEPFIEDVSGLKSIKTLARGLFINQLSNLTSFDGLENLVFVLGNVLISDNDGLKKIDGFSNLEKITGTLIIEQNVKLVSINGPVKLESVEVLSVEGNAELKNLGALESISIVETGIFIRGNGMLERISGFQNLAETGVISIENNDKLFSISGFETLRTLKGYLNTGFNLVNNSSLEMLNAFQSLEIVNKNFKVFSNGSLKEIDGFNSLNFVNGFFGIAQNNNLNIINGFSNLEAVIGDMVISDNKELISLSSFDSLSSINADLKIINNEELVAIEGFNRLELVEELMFITNNPSLQNITGFNSSKLKPPSILIGNNESLQLLICFRSINSLNYVIIENSPLLTDFCSFQLFFDTDFSKDQITFKGNGYNPSYEDLIGGRCKL
jgi:hypothetical protein